MFHRYERKIRVHYKGAFAEMRSYPNYKEQSIVLGAHMLKITPTCII